MVAKQLDTAAALDIAAINRAVGDRQFLAMIAGQVIELAHQVTFCNGGGGCSQAATLPASANSTKAGET